MTFIVIALVFGLATGVIGRMKGSSFFIWFLVGTALPGIGIFAALLYRYEQDEPLPAVPGVRQRGAGLGPGLHALRRRSGLPGAAEPGRKPALSAKSRC